MVSELARGGPGDKAGISQDMLTAELTSDAQVAYDRREAEIGDEVMRELERRVVLSVLDRKWREHLYEMDYLQEGIGLRAMAQRDPLVEYQREGFQLFQAMTEAIKEESVGYLFQIEVEVQPPRARSRRRSRPITSRGRCSSRRVWSSRSVPPTCSTAPPPWTARVASRPMRTARAPHLRRPGHVPDRVRAETAPSAAPPTRSATTSG